MPYCYAHGNDEIETEAAATAAAIITTTKTWQQPVNEKENILQEMIDFREIFDSRFTFHMAKRRRKKRRIDEKSSIP